MCKYIYAICVYSVYTRVYTYMHIVWCVCSVWCDIHARVPVYIHVGDVCVCICCGVYMCFSMWVCGCMFVVYGTGVLVMWVVWYVYHAW